MLHPEREKTSNLNFQKYIKILQEKMIGIILAAGRGSRMGNYTLNKPKSFIVYKEKLIDHILQNFKKNGINKFILLRL